MKHLGIVYLYHLDAPLDAAHPTQPRHYGGFCEFGRLPERDQTHHKGERWTHEWDGEKKHTGAARFLAVAVERGIDFRIVRTWRGTRDDERRLKQQKNFPALCPICNPRPRQVGFLDEIDVSAAMAAKKKRRS